MMKMWERYSEDPMFRNLVDVLQSCIQQGNFTPTEVREAAMLAQIKFEDSNPRPITFNRDQVVKGLV